MDLTNSTVKTPEAESETPTRIQPVKPLPFTNGVLKRHAPPPHLHHPVVVTYKECLKNHAAALGGHALDGCGEFMPSPSSNPADPTSLKCAACGCHRNFHRRDPEDHPLFPYPPSAAPALEYHPHHRHHPPPPPQAADARGNSGSSPSESPSPPPISSSYYPSAPHMLLALSHGLSCAPVDNGSTPITTSINSNSRKRFRTKFTQDQKDKMLELAEKVNWKMQKRDEDIISQFCSEIGVDKGVFKVWMHNNKNSLGKKEPSAATANGGGMSYGSMDAAEEGQYRRRDEENNDSKENVNGQEFSRHHIIGTNGSSSSS